MVSPRILLVDDVPGERANFAQAFGENLTVAADLAQLDQLIASGRRWDVAFVDFYLSSPTTTGLSAMLRLRDERPDCRLVTYSQFTESGRTLYAAAAKHWFAAQALLDKTRNEPPRLTQYVRAVLGGLDPTPERWQTRLRYAGLIDNLLAEPSWVPVWAAIREANGEMSRVANILQVQVSSLRTFKDRATEAALMFNEKFHDIPNPGDTRNKKGVLSSFASEHRHFLMAPDLSKVMYPGPRRIARPSEGRAPARLTRRIDTR